MATPPARLVWSISGRSCYTCEHYGRQVGRSYVWCELDDQPHVQSSPATGCVFWARAAGADEPEKETPAHSGR